VQDRLSIELLHGRLGIRSIDEAQGTEEVNSATPKEKEPIHDPRIGMEAFETDVMMGSSIGRLEAQTGSGTVGGSLVLKRNEELLPLGITNHHVLFKECDEPAAGKLYAVEVILDYYAKYNST
jgi:hypothetical protein